MTGGLKILDDFYEGMLVSCGLVKPNKLLC